MDCVFDEGGLLPKDRKIFLMVENSGLPDGQFSGPVGLVFAGTVWAFPIGWVCGFGASFRTMTFLQNFES